MAGGRASLATISARGGTTGRAAGWPTKFGLAGGRSGTPADTVPVPPVCPGGGADPGVGLSVGRAGIGIVGEEGAACAAGGALIGALAAGEGLAVSAIG